MSEPQTKTSRKFDPAAGIWTGYLNDSPNDTVVCALWRLFFIEPDVEAIPEKANKGVRAEIESRNEAAFATAKESAQAAYDSIPSVVKTTLGHGVGRVVGDKLNTSKADTDALKIQDCRDTYAALVAGESRVRSSTADPRVKLRELLASLDAMATGLTMTAAGKMAKDDSAKLYAKIAATRKVPVADYESDLEARVDAGLGG